LQTVADFARHFGKSPDKLGPNELRSYQAYLLGDRKLAVGTVVGLVAALRFFFNKTLKRRLPPNDIPYPKHPRRLPVILTEYWRWMKPKTWLFPGTVHNWRADKPLTPKVVWDACQFAAPSNSKGTPRAS
jgi:hypothetical protein